jgi:Domain of unknown function (DUF4360)
MLHKTFALLATSLLLGSANADAVIQSVQTSGSGCPGGNAVSTAITNGNFITVSPVSTFQAVIGGAPGQRQKNCQAMISVSVGPNEQFTVVQSDFPGYARLDSGVTASVFPTFYFQSHAADTVSK